MRKLALAVLLGWVALALLGMAGTAAADSVTPISSFTDPRGATPTRPGQFVRGLYGPYEVCGSNETIPPGSPGYPYGCDHGSIHNAINTTAPVPCPASDRPCRV